MKLRELENAVLELVHKPGYRPVKPGKIAKQLKLSGEQLTDVKKVVKRLVRDGKLVYEAEHRLRAPDLKAPEVKASGSTKKPQINRVVGVFRRMEAGYGFVRPSGTTPPDARSGDVFIPASKSGDASSGDVVVVRLGRPGGHHPGPKGEIVEIVQRQTHQFVGSYFEADGGAYVEVDGKAFSRPISVGDPTASDAEPNDKVVFEMVRFPSQHRAGEGVITEVLGQRGTPGVDTLSVIREFNLPEEFAEDALEESRKQADLFDESIPKGRLDATAETVLTIDPVDARDFDDAISLERLQSGHWRLGVHIADVSHFVRPKTALDREAYDRATSVYLPDRVIPMIPEIISNSLASLQPDRIRYTKTAYIEFTAEGLRVGTDVHSAAIKSRKRLAYEEVDDYLADREKWRDKLVPEVHDLLGRMHELAMILRRRRMQRGALELTMPEVKIELDSNGRVIGAKVSENTESHQIIEEFMLAANEAVAELLRDRGIEFLRRIHESPSPQKLKALGEFVTELGIKTESLESRFELQKLLDQVAGKPQQHAVNYAVLRSMQRAVYSPADEGHYALASDCYCHFTSPIRRYPDLTAHRLIEAILTGKKPTDGMDRLIVVGEHCSDREQQAESAERELTKLKLLAYLSDRIGEEMDAVVTGVESFGLFVQGIQLPAEGLVHVSSLDDDEYHFDRATHTLTGHREGNAYRLGDLVRVSVFRVDIDRRELDFRLAKPAAAGRRKIATPKKRTPKQRTPKQSPKKKSRRKRR